MWAVEESERLNERFMKLRSFYLFDTRFCNIASGNEKGDVEESGEAEPADVPDTGAGGDQHRHRFGAETEGELRA